MTHRQQSNLIAGICIVISIFFFISSLSIKIDGSYPRVLCITLMGLAVFTFIQSILEARKETEDPSALADCQLTTEELAERMAKKAEEKVSWQDLTVVTAIAFISIALWKPLSFLLASGLGMLALSLYKKQPLFKSILLACCTVLVLQLIFRNIFTIPLPSPSWWPYF